MAHVSEEAREERKLKENQIVEKSTTIASIVADVLDTSVAHEKQGQNENQIVEGSATALIAAGMAGTTMMAQEARDEKNEIEITKKSTIQATEDPGTVIGSEVERPFICGIAAGLYFRFELVGEWRYRHITLTEACGTILCLIVFSEYFPGLQLLTESDATSALAAAEASASADDLAYVARRARIRWR